jgi:hypothetical protein
MSSSSNTKGSRSGWKRTFLWKQFPKERRVFLQFTARTSFPAYVSVSGWVGWGVGAITFIGTCTHIMCFARDVPCYVMGFGVVRLIFIRYILISIIHEEELAALCHFTIYLSIYLTIYLSVCLSVYLYVYLSIYQSINQSINQSIINILMIFVKHCRRTAGAR